MKTCKNRQLTYNYSGKNGVVKMNCFNCGKNTHVIVINKCLLERCSTCGKVYKYVNPSQGDKNEAINRTGEQCSAQNTAVPANNALCIDAGAYLAYDWG